MKVTNKSILKSIKKRLDDAKGSWAEKLPSILWEIRMTLHSGTRETPFNLVFGSDAIILVEIKINTLQLAHFDLKQNESGIRAKLDLF